MPKITVKQDFTVPGHPKFTSGGVFNVGEDLAKLAVKRGYAEILKPKKETVKETKPRPKKETKKSNKLKDE
jgi:hypothetical protein